jgi:hypothetical protein
LSLVLKFHHRAIATTDVAKATLKNEVTQKLADRPPKRDRQVVRSPQNIISKHLCSQEEHQADVTKATLKNAAPKNQIDRPPNTDPQVLESPKTIAKPFCMQEEWHSRCSAQENTKCSNHFSEVTNASADAIPARSEPISKIASPEAFHTRSNNNQKHDGSAKIKLCIVPVLQTQIISQASSGSPKSKVKGHHIQSNISTSTPIPAPSILMPARLISQFEAVPNSLPIRTLTRSIGIQVELQPISDIKLM